MNNPKRVYFAIFLMIFGVRQLQSSEVVDISRRLTDLSARVGRLENAVGNSPIARLAQLQDRILPKDSRIKHGHIFVAAFVVGSGIIIWLAKKHLAVKQEEAIDELRRSHKA